MTLCNEYINALHSVLSERQTEDSEVFKYIVFSCTEIIMSLTQLAARVPLFRQKVMFCVENIENKDFGILNVIRRVFLLRHRPVPSARPCASGIDYSVMWRSPQRVVGRAVSTRLAAGDEQMAREAVTRVVPTKSPQHSDIKL